MKSELVLIAILVSGCGSAQSGSSSAQHSTQINASNLSGSYAGTEFGTQAGRNFSENVSLILTQNGQSVSGTFIDSGGSGSVTGTNPGSGGFTFQISEAAPCTGQLTGSTFVVNNTLQASISGSTACGFVSATIQLTPQ